MLDVMAPGIVQPERKRLRIAYSEAFPPGTRGKLTHETSAALRDTAELLEDLGHEVVERDPDFRARDLPVILALMFRGIRDIVLDVERPQRLERRSRHIARPGVLIRNRPSTTCSGRAADRRARRPAVGRPRRAADADAVRARRPRAADGGPRRDRHLPVGERLGTVRCALELDRPARGVGPAGFDDDGLPLAVQLVGRPHGEGTLLALAGQIEDARPWVLHRPPAFDC